MRTGDSARPQSSRIGRGRSMNRVSTVPTDPTAVRGAGVAMRAIISRGGPPARGSRQGAVGTRASLYDPKLVPTSVDGSRLSARELTMAETSVNNGVNVGAL